MDKELKKVLNEYIKILIGEFTFFSILLGLLKDIHLTLIYNILAGIIIWLIYLQIKISKNKGGKK